MSYFKLPILLPQDFTRSNNKRFYLLEERNSESFLEEVWITNCVSHLSSALKWWRLLQLNILTHWGRVTHICVGKLSIIGSDNGLSPGRRQAIIWTNTGMLLIGPLGTNFSEILTFSFKKMRLKVSSAKSRPFCLGLNVLIIVALWCHISTWIWVNTGSGKWLVARRHQDNTRTNIELSLVSFYGIHLKAISQEIPQS